MKKDERAVLDRLVHTLVAFGLKMAKETTAKNTVEFILEPYAGCIGLP